MLCNGRGTCPQCGRGPEEILAMRERICLLTGCGQRFQPTHSAARTCCPEHAHLYELQEQRRRRAESLGKLPKPPRQRKPELSVGLGSSAPLAPARQCHDCGKPTRDYRCPKCRKAWARSHGVPWCGEDLPLTYRASL